MLSPEPHTLQPCRTRPIMIGLQLLRHARTARFSKTPRLSQKLPAIDPSIGSGTGTGEGGLWWVKIIIDIDHPMAWRIVQELGHVLNYVSLNERLPTVFMPVSPPPYIHGGPRNFLSWVIESSDATFTP